MSELLDGREAVPCELVGESSGSRAADPMVIFNRADQVREPIQQTLHHLLEKRPDPFGR